MLTGPYDHFQWQDDLRDGVIETGGAIAMAGIFGALGYYGISEGEPVDPHVALLVYTEGIAGLIFCGGVADIISAVRLRRQEKSKLEKELS